MARTKTYNLALLQLSVGGRKIGGFGAEGGVTITWGGDLFDVQVGADGEAVASFNNDQSAIVEITVMESSKGYRDLAELQAKQLGEVRTGPLGRMEVRMKDPINGDKLADQYGVFLNRPEMTKGKVAGERVFRISCPNAGASLEMGTGNTV